MIESAELYIPLLYGGAGILGLVSCFYGFRLFKVILIAILAVAGAAGLAWAGFHYGEQPVIWSAGGLLLGAALGGILAIFFYSLSVATLGALFVATSLLPWVQPYELWVQWSILGVACLVAALLAVTVTNLMIQLASAMLGALMVVHSVLYFTSGRTIHEEIEGEEGWVHYFDLDLQVAGAALVLGLVGFLIQRRAAR
ncbi:MAG: DUF4203 domain-containing protein [Oceanipulchritudo sp.]